MITQLDSENADRNLTSQVTVLTHTPNASLAMLCQALVQVGDGTKNLDGTGGDFELEITVGGNTVQPGPQVITMGASDTRASFVSAPFPVPANTAVVVKLLSPNAGDTDVDVTAYLYDVQAVNTGTIQTLDALDTAQDSQHSTTQSAVATVDGVADAIKAVTDLLPNAGALSSIAQDTDIQTLLTRLTATRAGYLDKLNISGNVASSAEVTSVQNNTRCVRVVPTVIERPDSGTQTYRIELLLYDDVGNMEAPDSAPTIALVDQDGNDLSSRLDSATMSLVSTGRYRAVYTATDTDDLEQLVWAFSVVEGGNTRVYGNTSVIVDTTAVDFTASDRSNLGAIKAVTDLLPDGGALNDLAAILTDTGTTLPATLAAITGYIDTEIAAIKAVTDNLPDSGSLSSLAQGSALATVDANVDSILVAALLLRKIKTNIFRDKSGSPGVRELLDDDDTTPILEVTLSGTTPYQQTSTP